MNDSDFSPVSIFKFKSGKTVRFFGKEICCHDDRYLSLNDGQLCLLLSFSRQEGMASYSCFAIVKSGNVLIFEGDQIGRNMITELAVKQAVENI